MARIAMVTRTISTTNLEVLCLDITTATPTTKKITLVGAISDERTLMKLAKEQLETETLKAVHITSVQDIETLYGMSEEQFIKVAEVLPPRK